MWVIHFCITTLLLLRAQGDIVSIEDIIEKMESMAREHEESLTQMQMELTTMKMENQRIQYTLKQHELTLKDEFQDQDSTSFFSVQLTENKEVAHNGTVVFDLVKVNYGDDYIQSGGIYIAPQDGYYMFTLVVREKGNNHCAGSVMRIHATDPNNAVLLCRAEGADYGSNTGSCTVITELLAGDQISVIADGYHADDVESSHCLADGYTSLTGFLIRSGLE